MLATLGHAGEDATVVAFLDGPVLVDPGAQEMAAAFGLVTALERSPLRRGDRRRRARPASRPRSTARRRASTRWSIEREALGGQAGTSSMIRNYLGFARGIAGRRARHARLPAGVGLRGHLPDDARRGAPRPRGRRPGGADRRRRRGAGGRGDPGHRRLVPPARHPGARRADRRRGVLRRVGLGGARVRGRGRLPGGRRQLGRAGRAPPGPPRAARHARGARAAPSPRACPTTSSSRSTPRRT